MRNSVICEIDGMDVIKTKDNVIIISDDRPRAKEFTGYAVSDYFKYIVDMWKRARLQRDKEIQRQIAEGIIKAVDVPLRANVPWPVMPESCTRYNKEEAEKDSEKVTLKQSVYEK